MGREVRRVPENWQHPKNEHGHYTPLRDGSGFARNLADWETEKAMWDRGFRRTWKGDAMIEVALTDEQKADGFDEWYGSKPEPEDYMPQWTDEERTHWQMYEDTTEGTPISPVMASPEELARWLADNGASAFGRMTATYEQWLATINEGWAPSLVVSGGVMQSGVAATAEK